MSSKKSASPEAAQKKLWKDELKQLEKERRTTDRAIDLSVAVTEDSWREARAALKKAQRAVAAAERVHNSAVTKHAKALEKYTARKDRALKAIDTRIAILRGRIG